MENNNSNPNQKADPTPTKTFRFDTIDLQPQSLGPQKPCRTKAFLNVIRSRTDLGIYVFIDGPVVVGRDPECNIPLQDLGVSRRHMMISPTPSGEFVLTDLKSTNGTRVNGMPVAQNCVLKDGEKIIVGGTVLRFGLADQMDIDFHSEISTLVNTDPLTGLPSKRRFDQTLEFAMRDCGHKALPLSLLMMDMDGLKKINDTHGHLFGAYAISETGKLIARVLGGTGQACRFGGDEFSAFLPGYNVEAAAALAEEIRIAVENAGLEKDGILLKPTISIGVAAYPDTGKKVLELVASADEALYRAKAMGKNCVAS